MEFQRSSGVLLHITSLPGAYGVGDLGRGAYEFIDWLVTAKQKWWQMLPLGPANDSPGGRDNDIYSSLSSWAGSPLYVSIDQLIDKGDLRRNEASSAIVPAASIDYPALRISRARLFSRAAERFLARKKRPEKAVFASFCRREAHWLDDWALFAALKEHFQGTPWWNWPKDIARRDPSAVAAFARRHQLLVSKAKYIQFRFFEQWEMLRKYAVKKGIRLIGDVPIYCAADSVDVWCSPKMFKLRSDGQPRAVAGVPPDYFSKDGQLWNTPVYDWNANIRNRFQWWIWRLKGCLRTVDVVRIDHFRGFEAYWEIPAPAKNARGGRWVKGPGHSFFAAVRRALGDAPFIAEDLGFITGKVNELRERWGLPGMRVLQFAFSGRPQNCHLPFWHSRDCVVYPGTHDNDTTRGWYEQSPAVIKKAFKRYTGSDGKAPHWDMLEYALSSVAGLVVVPVQDVLGLDSGARMNTPGQDKGNYLWRLKPGQLKSTAALRLAELTVRYARA